MSSVSTLLSILCFNCSAWFFFFFKASCEVRPGPSFPPFLLVAPLALPSSLPPIHPIPWTERVYVPLGQEIGFQSCSHSLWTSLQAQLKPSRLAFHPAPFVDNEALKIPSLVWGMAYVNQVPILALV